jgi:hypothetical protein
LINLSHRSWVGWHRFNEPLGPHEPAVLDPVHRTVNLFHIFSNRKIILKNPRIRNFCKLTLKLFQNYILVPVILHLGP